MQTIQRYKITRNTCTINMPIYAKILHTKAINDNIYIWAYTSTEDTIAPRTFKCFNTDDECFFENDRIYIGTVHIKKAGWGCDSIHIFEVI